MLVNTKTRLWHIAKYISNLRFSISLLLTIAIVSVVGTLIEQDQPLEYYKLNYPASNSTFVLLTWRSIVSLGLSHIYSAPWFIVILLLFFFSLSFCTLSTQLPMLQGARRWKFLYSEAAIANKTSYCRLKCCSFMNLSFVLTLRNYCVFHKRQAVYAYKGLAGRLAPIFVHFGIILTLLGSVIGFVNGFMAQEIVPSGEVFHLQNFVKSGYCSSTPSGLLGRVDDFFLTFNDDNSVQQFFSSISLMDSKGNVLLEQLMSVNRPLKFNGVTLYQTDWKVSALRVKIGPEKQFVKVLRQSTLNNISGSPFWLCSLILAGKHKVFVAVPALNDELLVYDSQGFLIHTTRYGMHNVIYGVPIVFKDLMASTGLQIKTDPGVNLAYSGFLILIVSILLSYTSYSQVWSSAHDGVFYCAGETNRALVAFENEMAVMQKKYTYLSELIC